MFALDISPDYIEKINEPNFWDDKKYIQKALGVLDSFRLSRYTEKVKKIAMKNDIWHIMEKSVLSSVTEFDIDNVMCARSRLRIAVPLLSNQFWFGVWELRCKSQTLGPLGER